VEGSSVEAGKKVLRIVDHSTLWLDASIYERDIPFITEGQMAEATTPAFPGRTFSGRVILIHPHLDMMTRTATARILIRNPGLDLKPGMYAAVDFSGRALERTILAPREAIIDTGLRQLAFVHLGGGRFDPREVRTGIEGERGLVQVLDGLKPGDLVVTSGQFLLDAESRTQEATRKFVEDRRLKATALKAAPASGRRVIEEVKAPPLDPAVREKAVPRIDALIERYLETAQALARDALGTPSPRRPSGARPGPRGCGGGNRDRGRGPQGCSRQSALLEGSTPWTRGHGSGPPAVPRVERGPHPSRQACSSLTARCPEARGPPMSHAPRRVAPDRRGGQEPVLRSANARLRRGHREDPGRPMITRLIELSIRNKLLVVLLTGIVVVLGASAMTNIRLDAIRTSPTSRSSSSRNTPDRPPGRRGIRSPIR
jgi:hypothetical protein